MLVSFGEASDPAGGTMVVVVEVASAVVSEEAPGVGDTMLSPPSTHAEANVDSTTRREISLGMGGECRKGADLCCGNGPSGRG